VVPHLLVGTAMPCRWMDGPWLAAWRAGLALLTPGFLGAGSDAGLGTEAPWIFSRRSHSGIRAFQNIPARANNPQVGFDLKFHAGFAGFQRRRLWLEASFSWSPGDPGGPSGRRPFTPSGSRFRHRRDASGPAYLSGASMWAREISADWLMINSGRVSLVQLGNRRHLPSRDKQVALDIPRA
jgi:hypothetical protein